jgi:cytochrome c biogenesis protein CcmG/thiol:disulfide interchange protein DsbE
MQTRMDRPFILTIAGLTVALVMVVQGAIHQPLIEVGDKAPSFSFQTDDGQTINPAAPDGRLLILNFWASWCPPCIEEMPSLNRLASDLRKDGVVVAAVSIDHNAAAYTRFVQQMRPGFATYRDPEGDLAASFGTFRVPETYVIDASGRVLQKYISNRNWIAPEIVSEIRSFLR